MITIATLDSPIGPLTTAERGTRVCMLHFGPDGRYVDEVLQKWHPDEPRARRTAVALGVAPVLEKYFSGDIAALDAIDVELNGTPFQVAVWKALRRIRRGTTISYLELARRIGRPAAVRAVGAANGANPVAVIVPCHRVIGANGTLTGFGGGLPRKQWLLEHEGCRSGTLF